MDRPNSLRRVLSLTLATAAAAGWLAGCATPPGGAAPTAGPKPPPGPTPTGGPPAPATPEPPPPPPPPPEPPPAGPAAQQQAQRLASAAVESLEGGNEEQASAELQRALQLDPSNRLAQSLLKQIQTDPQTLLGREFFIHRVQPGESLSRIAGRFLGDVHLFYALARYNDIRVPRQVQGGQAIKVPGRAPPPSPPPPAQPPPAPPPPPARPAVDDKAAERERQAKIAAATRAARRATANQDLRGAIRQWDIVLELDPNNSTAQLERKRAADLLKRLDELGKK